MVFDFDGVLVLVHMCYCYCEGDWFYMVVLDKEFGIWFQFIFEFGEFDMFFYEGDYD